MSKLKQATPDAHLLGNLMNPSYPKNEMEQFASREIQQLRQQVAELTAKLDKAREALERIVNGDVWVETEYSIAKTALEELDK